MRPLEKKQSTPYDALFQEIKKADSVSEFLSEITHAKKLYEVFEMYTYFRDNQPAETLNFKNLDLMITHPQLDDFWKKVLNREQGYQAFRGVLVHKNHRLNKQPENKRDLLHPLFVLAGAYYYRRITKRQPAFYALTLAICHIESDQFDSALTKFEEKFLAFKPGNATETDYQEIILKQVERLKALKNLTDPDNYETVTNAFETIQAQIDKLGEIQNKELEAGMKYGCTRCYTAAQYLDLYTIDAIVCSETGLLSAEVTELICRIEARAEKVEDQHGIVAALKVEDQHGTVAALKVEDQHGTVAALEPEDQHGTVAALKPEDQHGTVAALLAGRSYLQLADAMLAHTQLMKKKISPHTLFPIPRTCGYITKKSPSAEDREVGFSYVNCQRRQIVYFNKALRSLYRAERLEALGNTALIHNATGGKKLSDTNHLKYAGFACKNAREFRECMETRIARLYPKITSRLSSESNTAKENGPFVRTEGPRT